MGWHPYDLDHLAQEIVLKARHRDADSLNQAYKMRASCAYGLERFWGEHLRLADKDKEMAKAQFVADVWKALVGILGKTGLSLPADLLSSKDSEQRIQTVAEGIWRLKNEEQQAALSVLTALCDAVVWWTQRLKTGKGSSDG